jgi:hypothetical protein
VLTVEELAGLLSERRYRQGWALTVHEGQTSGEAIVRIYAPEVPDSWNPGRSVPLDIFAVVPEPARDDVLSFDRWLSWRLQRIEAHEAQEWYRKPGRDFPWVPVFDPHRAGADRDVWPIVPREQFVPPAPVARRA